MRFEPGCNLKGTLWSVPSKSDLHRAILAACLADDPVTIGPVVDSEDVQATLRLARALGASIKRSDNHILVTPRALPCLDRVDCGESGTTLRLGIALAAGLGLSMTFTGTGRLGKRPLGPILDLFDRQQLKYEYAGRLPLTIAGRLQSGTVRIDGSLSSQFVSGLMMALPLLVGDSVLEITGTPVSEGYMEMTRSTLRRFGVAVEPCEDGKYRIRGRQQYHPKNVYIVEGDYSQAAFWMVAAALGGDLALKGLDPESLQPDRAIIRFLKRMGARIAWQDQALYINRSPVIPATLDLSPCPDLAPILTLLGAIGMGTTILSGTGRLKHKESDRARAMAEELGNLGARIEVEEDRMIITGVEHLTGGTVHAWNDHRIAMTLAIASLVCEAPVTIDGFDAVRKSYPHFLDDYRSIGGIVHGS